MNLIKDGRGANFMFKPEFTKWEKHTASSTKIAALKFTIASSLGILVSFGFYVDQNFVVLGNSNRVCLMQVLGCNVNST